MHDRLAGIWMLTVQVLVAFVVYRLGVPSNNEMAIPYVVAVAIWVSWVCHAIPTFIAMARGKQWI